MLTLTGNFSFEKEQLKYSPVYLVEFSSLDKFYATREPGFSGLWIAGQDLVAGSVLAGATLPEYETVLHRVADSGVGQMSYVLDSEGFARTGSGSVVFLNQDFLSHELSELLMENTGVLIRLGFYGYNREDYITVFRGIVDTHQATYEAFDLNLIDDTLRQLIPVPPQIGNDIFPRSFSKGAALPIIIGEAKNVPTVQLIGAASSFLGFDITTGSTYILTTNLDAPYPATGSLDIISVGATSTVVYDSVETESVGNKTYNRFNLTTLAGTNHAAGAVVELVDFDYTYLLSFTGENVRRIRSAGGYTLSQPTLHNIPIEPDGSDDRKATIISFPSAEATVTADVSGSSRGENLFATTQNTPVFGDGGWQFTVPGGRFERVLEGTVNALQVTPSDAYWQVSTIVGHTYSLSVVIDENGVAPYLAVTVGTIASPAEYLSYSEFTGQGEQEIEVSFVAKTTVTRLGMIVGNPGAGLPISAYFSNFDMFDTATENPEVGIRHIVETHMPNIAPHEASFAEANSMWGNSLDRCSGIIQQTEEQQALLGRIAQQFRAKTFLNEQGHQKLVVFDQSRLPTYDFTTNNIHKGSMTVSKSDINEVFTSVAIYYNRRPTVNSGADLGGRDAFAGLAFCDPTKTNHSTEQGLSILLAETKRRYKINRHLEIFADLIFDTRTAENLLSYVTRRGAYQRTVCEFTSYLGGIEVEIGDFVRISHPLLPAASQFGKFEITAKTLEPNGCFTKFVGEEINPFRFGGYTEHWEPNQIGFANRIYTEHWEPPTVILGPHVFDEHWENFIPGANDGFERWSGNRYTHNVKTLIQFRDVQYYGGPAAISFGHAEGFGFTNSVSGHTEAELPAYFLTTNTDSENIMRTGASVRESEAGGLGNIVTRGEDSLQVFSIVTVSDVLASGLGPWPVNTETVGDMTLITETELPTRVTGAVLNGPGANIDFNSNFTIRVVCVPVSLRTGYGANTDLPTATAIGPILAIRTATQNIATIWIDASHKYVFSNGGGVGTGFSSTPPNNRVTSVNSFIENTAQHIFARWDSVAKTMSITVDNDAAVTATIATPVYGIGTQWDIGRLTNGFTAKSLAGWWFSGSIGEITQWTRLLTDDEITNLSVYSVWPYEV